MLEPDVALTDYALTLESGAFAWLLARRGAARRGWSVLFFASVAAAALLGGTVHGFFPGDGGLGALLWRATLLATGLTTLAAWALGARLALSPSAARVVTGAAVLQLVAYAVVVLAVTDEFRVAVVNYVPAAVALGVALAVARRRTRARPALVGALGVGVLLGGSWVLVKQVALHPVYLTHNAVYHVIEAVALAMLYHAAAWWTSPAWETHP